MDYVTPPQQTNHVTTVMSPPKATTTPGLKLNSHLSEVLEVIQNNATLCPKTTHPTVLQYRNNVWHMYNNHKQEIYIYSAFFDDRPAIGVLLYVRLLAVAMPTDNPLYYQLWYDGIINPLVVKMEVKRSYRGLRGPKIRWTNY